MLAFFFPLLKLILIFGDFVHCFGTCFINAYVLMIVIIIIIIIIIII